jgi:endonuclease/exonuclease/phosphatase family metal-dependent hydrolase
MLIMQSIIIKAATYNVARSTLTDEKCVAILKKIEEVDYLCLQEAQNVTNVTVDMIQSVGHTVIRANEFITVIKGRAYARRKELEKYGLVTILDNGCVIVNVHLRPWIKGKEGRHEEKFLAYLRTINLDQVIIAGDFNDAPMAERRSQSKIKQSKRKVLRRGLVQLGMNITRFHSYTFKHKSNQSESRIDYVVSRYQMVDFVENIVSSDHMCVTSEIVWPSQKKPNVFKMTVSTRTYVNAPKNLWEQAQIEVQKGLKASPVMENSVADEVKNIQNVVKKVCDKVFVSKELQVVRELRHASRQMRKLRRRKERYGHWRRAIRRCRAKLKRLNRKSEAQIRHALDSVHVKLVVPVTAVNIDGHLCK